MKLNKIENWAKMPKSGLQLPDTSDRQVKISINSEGTTRLTVKTDLGEFFLATVVGNDVLDFRVKGQAKISAHGDPAWYICDEVNRPVVHHDAPTTFTKIVERAPRNPELELMMAKVNQSVDRRIAIMEQASAAKLKKADARAAAAEAALRSRAERDAAANNGGTVSGGTPEAADGVSSADSEGAGVEGNAGA